MNFKAIYLLLWILPIFYSCINSKPITGRYTNELGDKLVVRRNMTYKLVEKIDTRARITKGKWQEWTKDGVNKIQFINVPAYEIENNHTLRIENSNATYSSVKVFYADTDSIIPIPYAYGFFKNDTISLMGLHSGYFETFTFHETLDSLFLSMWKYRDITVKIPDTLKHVYIFRFYPTETIYQFDRIYNLIEHNLFPTDSMNTNKRLRFKKYGV